MKKLMLHRKAGSLPFSMMLLGFGALLAGTVGWQTGGNDFATRPPKVRRAWIQKLSQPTAQGNARLFVRFQPDQRLASSSVTLTLPDDAGGGQTTLVLHDDGKDPDTKAGDGTFSAITTINDADLATVNANIDRAGNQQQVPIFNQRSLSGPRKVKFLDVASFSQFKAIPFFPPSLTVSIDPPRSLLITATIVVEDPIRTFNPCTNVGNPNGKWTFGHLMTEMANQPLTGIAPSAFVRQWLNNWLLSQSVNGDAVLARAQIQSLIITPWEIASGVGPGGPLNLNKAPFKLLAIVNRIDLKDSTVYGGSNAGEGRFVFCALDPACNPLQFTVIFEYGINRKGCAAIQNWGQQWVNLQAFALGSPAYNAALESVTEQFVKRNADPSKPNGSALNQLRTDEIELDFVAGWELREFKLSPNTNTLLESTVKQTPAYVANNNTSDVGNFVNPIAPLVVADSYTVPLQFPGITPYLGGKAPNHFDFWQDNGAPAIVVPDARHHFSLNTCNACHGRETNTGFTMVQPAPFGSPAGLAGFLTGISVVDPVDGVTVRTFNDIARRQTVLSNIVSIPCPLSPFFDLFADTIRAVH